MVLQWMFTFGVCKHCHLEYSLCTKLRPERGAKHFLTKFSENPFENEGLLVQGKSPTYQQVTGGGGERGRG